MKQTLNIKKGEKDYISDSVIQEMLKDEEMFILL